MGDNPASGFKGLRLHNTLTRAKEDFVPIDAGDVRMYVCGPTVYDDAHIGNARPAIVFDVLYRLLLHLAKQGVWDGGKGETKVTYVRNITDVDDKIIDRARRDFPEMALNDAIAKVTAETEARYHADVKALGCLATTVEPRATGHIADMIELVRTLIEKKHAYEAEGHVLFDVKSWRNAKGEAEYGKLSRRPLDEMIAGARVEVALYKRDAMDFVLWKPSSAEEPGWESPWGRGRPGWHLECSAMSEKHLGKTFDIHGGGVDLVFPHHENEIAQSRCAHGTDVMANYWLHNGFLQVEGEKMAKSAGNFVTIHELLKNWEGYSWPGEALRFNMLRTHYRQPIDWTLHSLDESHKILWDWYGHIGDGKAAKNVPKSVVEALSDDLNTPKAISELHKMANKGRYDQLLSALNFMGFSGERKKIERGILAVGAAAGRATAKGIAGSIGAATGKATVTGIAEAVHSKKVDDLIAARNAARTAKNWAEADRIRDELDAMGIQLHDAKDPDTGEFVTTREVKR